MGSEGRRPTAAVRATEPSASAELEAWLADAGLAGPYDLRPLSGGNSNETMLLSAGGERLVMRRPPRATIDASAHNVGREDRILAALAETAVPAPAPRGLCVEEAVPEAPFLLMEAVDGVSLGDELPAEWAAGPGAAVGVVGRETASALADLHTLDWRGLGLGDFGRPEEFLARQVPRWRKQLDRYRHRELPDFEPVAAWLEANRPPDVPPGILHGDFHVDNCLFEVAPRPRLAAIIDWEMSTIGDPLLDVGLFLGFWGSERARPMGMPWVQAISRVDGAPSRAELAALY
ncbi:MAG: phosphotransferase family protein, partial [Actinobacteria bacterium]|nr:phosphotransferase family protein [Actinomycetota bacterium]